MSTASNLGDGLRHLQSLGLPRLEAQMLLLHVMQHQSIHQGPKQEQQPLLRA